MVTGEPKPAPLVNTTSLASFIAIVRADLRDPREKKSRTAMIWVAGGFGLLGVSRTPYHVQFLGVAVIILGTLAMTSYQQILNAQRSPETVNLGHLFGFLNYNRAKVGLHSVVGQEMLNVLESEARVWEQIESGLQSEGWKSQPELRDRIQQQADRAMTELISLGTSAASIADYNSWHAGWDHNTAKLREILVGMRHAERLLFIYPRVNDLTAEAEIPEVPDLERLHAALAD